MLYLGPEVLMPLASVAAAIGGVLLMFWRRVVGAMRAVVRFVLRQPKPEAIEAALPSDAGVESPHTDSVHPS